MNNKFKYLIIGSGPGGTTEEKTLIDHSIFDFAIIEEGKLDQHEASVKVGQALKELYVDSAMQQQKKREELEAKRRKKGGKPVKKISWSDYKKLEM